MTGDFDVVVAGAGPAGSAAARHLALAGKSVAIVESSTFEGPRIGESLVPEVRPLFAGAGIWERFLATSPIPSYGNCSVWGDAEPRMTSHMTSPWGNGWHVDRLALDRLLVQEAERAGARLFCGQAIRGAVHDAADRRWRLELPAMPLRAGVLIDATGRSARIATRLGARRHLFDHMVGAAVEFEGVERGEEQGFVLVEAVENGWWYSAPLPGGRMIVTLMTDADLCASASLNSLPAWSRLLCAAPATQARVACAAAPSAPRIFSAVSQRLCRSDVESPWLAIGDAALAVDPVSGGGVVRALRSASEGAQTALAILAGDVAGAVTAFETARDGECSGYLSKRARFYGYEQRWPQSQFWRRRRAATATSS